MSSPPPQLLTRALDLLHVDLSSHRPAPWRRAVTATVLSVVASLVADAALVAAGTALFPATKGYVHFRFADYGRLTVVGVVVACLAWPVTVRFCSAPRWLYLRMAVAVTLFLWIPDLWLLVKGQPASAVAVLMAMHLAIAFIAYNCVVHVAKVTDREPAMALASSE